MFKNFVFSLLITTCVTCHAIDYLKFVARGLKDMKTVGTLVPLTDSAAQEVARNLPDVSDQVHHYLEIGAGIGNITTRLVEKLGPNDTLDVIEILPGNCKTLREKFGNDPRITIHQVDFLQWQPTYSCYDVVISTVPHTTLGLDFTKNVFTRYKALTNGVLVFVQLALVHRFKFWDSEYQEITHMFDELKRENRGTSTLKWTAPCGVWIHSVPMKKAGNKKID